MSSERSEPSWNAIESHSAIRVTGDDATDFLHAQLTSDVAALSPLTVQWSAWLTPKGRVISILLVIRVEPNHYVIVYPKSLDEILIKRLKMYVLRAKVDIEPLPAMHKLADDPATTALLSSRNIEPGQVERDADGLLVNLTPIAATATAYRIDDTDVSKVTTDSSVESSSWDDWITRYAQPWVEQQTTDQFIPQSLNLDAVGGLSYDKGCYPGQEIVARTHFKGRLKYRAAVLNLDVDEVLNRGSKLRLVDDSSRSAVVIATGNKQVLAVVPVGWLDEAFDRGLDGGQFVVDSRSTANGNGGDELGGRILSVTAPP